MRPAFGVSAGAGRCPAGLIFFVRKFYYQLNVHTPFALRMSLIFSNFV